MARDNLGRFVKGDAPWNKGKFGFMGANRTSFTAAGIQQRRHIGQPRMGKDQLVCCSEEKYPVKSRNGKTYLHQKRMSYPKWLMEKHLGRALNKNEVVYHKDLDILNNDISNLEVITRGELLKRNQQLKGK